MSCRFSITDGAAEDLRVLAGLSWGVFILLADKEQRLVTEDPISSAAQLPNSAADVLLVSYYNLPHFMQNKESIFNSELLPLILLLLVAELDNISAIKHMCRSNRCPYLFESKQKCTHLLVCLFCRLNSLTPFFSLVTFGWEECMCLLGMSDCVLCQRREKHNHQYVFSLQNEQTLMYSCIWII